MACWGGAFMGGQIVQDDDVALFEGRGELGADIGLEDRAVHWRVDDPWRGQGAAAQSGDESLGLPMAKGSFGAKASAFRAAPARTRHLRVGSRLVEETSLCGSVRILGCR